MLKRDEIQIIKDVLTALNAITSQVGIFFIKLDQFRSPKSINITFWDEGGVTWSQIVSHF